MNPASLNKRIKELRELEIIDHSGDGYHLTKHGRSLMAAFEPLQAWADAWARQVDI
jgi:DNA-binding HxlR family transcriptional regulator